MDILRKKTEHSRQLFSDQITLPIHSIYKKESKWNIQLCPQARLGFKVTLILKYDRITFGYTFKRLSIGE